MGTDVLTDLRLALRGLSRSPGIAVVAVLTLAIGIGASTAIFSVVSGVLLRSLPYPEPDRLMQVSTVNQFGRAGRVSYPDFEDLREQNQSFTGLAAYADWTLPGSAAGEGFRIHWAQVSPGFFTTLRVMPAIGRPFSAEEERTGASVAIVSHRYWQTRLVGTADVDAQRVRVGERSYAVVGVMPGDYDFPPGSEVWVPRDPLPENRTAHNWSVVGRLGDSVGRTRAELDLSAIAQRLRERYGDYTDTTAAAVRPVLEQVVGNVRPALRVLLGAAVVLLIVACVNVANLLLARALARDRESALRLALGSGPMRLARGFVAEALLLAWSGAGFGLVIAFAGVPALMALEPGLLPRVQNVGVDWRVLAFAVTTALLLGLIMGFVPAVRAVRRDTRDAVAGSRRIQGSGAANRRLRGVLVAAQVAMTAVLLIGAGLLGRTVLGLLAVDPGFRTEGALVMHVWLPYPDVQNPEPGAVRIGDFISRLMQRLRAIPGVERVGGVNHFPLQGGGPDGTFIELQRLDEIPSFEAYARVATDSTRTGDAEFRVADADYFRAMGIPLVRGRLFDARDTAEAPHVAVISAALGEARWPGQDPVGKLIFFGNMDGDLRPFTIVGVVGDIREYGLDARPLPTFYADYRQRPRTAAEFHVALVGDLSATGLVAAARRAARDVDAEVPTELESVEKVVSGSVAERRFVLVLLALFAAVALVLATTGVYAALAYRTLQRTPEIGVRLALGAQGRDVARLIVAEGVALAVAGILTGLVAAFAIARVLDTLLYGVAALDPATFAVSATVLLVAALFASGLPAWRASRIAPVVALRHE